MISILGMLGGALIRYLPNFFGFFGDWFKTKQDQKQEENLLKLNIQLEGAKAAGSVKVAEISSEQAQILASIQASVDELHQTVVDRKSAREYGSKLHTALVNVLNAGARLGISKWVLAPGWVLVVLVECAAASVQPGIAAAGFAMWALWKWNLFALPTNTQAGCLAMWTAEDWILIDSIVGFFLAGRAMKYGDAKDKK